jgi:CHAT domain-containing protein
LPWELLLDRSADAGSLPALDPRRPIVRTIDSMEQTLPPSQGPLRQVLVAWSNPRNSEYLNLDAECAAVKEALGRIPICPEIQKNATRPKLIDSISDGEHQIVHFMGHGTFDPTIGEGVLLLEDEHGGQDPMEASTFASLFGGKPMPRLVILASCYSAEPGRDPAFGPFASVAAALVAAGLPAVIAMQTAVRDRSAIRFTDRLYRRIVAGDPIEAAVSHARIALQAGWPGALDWAVPVLFVRGQGFEASREDSTVQKPLPSPEHRPAVVHQTISTGNVGNQQIIGSAHDVRQGDKQ